MLTVDCVCSGAGNCPLRGREVSTREYQLCKCIGDDKRFYEPMRCLKRRIRWMNEKRITDGLPPLVDPPARQSEKTKHVLGKGPGTHLKEIFAAFGIEPEDQTEAGCASCNDLLRAMDAWGVQGCLVNKDEILRRLREKYKTVTWKQAIFGTVKATFSGELFAFNPLDPVPDFFNEALERAMQTRNPKLSLACVYRGNVSRKLSTETGRATVFKCEIHGECTVLPNEGMKDCMTCRDRVATRQEAKTIPLPVACLTQSRPSVRLDQSTLSPSIPGMRFNPSIIPWKDGYLFTFRNGWKGSEIYVVQLDSNLQQAGEPIKLDLTHPEANYGREDPRLFIHRDRLHISYSGVVGGQRIRHTNVLYARLSDELRVEQIYAPKYAQRNPWEKNWQFFDHNGQLYAVYTITPHKILRIDGENASVAYETSTKAPWHLQTEMRGGASPVRVGDEFYSFFHSRVEVHGHRVYVTGVYTFEAKPPFKPQRVTTLPIDVADPATKPPDQYASVVWAGGAVRHGEDWLVATGIHDRWSELRFWNAERVEQELVHFNPPSWWNQREWWADPGIWLHVVGYDEYRLVGSKFTPQDVIIDIGSHVGTFAYKVRQYGAVQVDCYEPFEDSTKLLQANALYMPGVRVFNEAIGETYAKGRMQKPHESNSGSGNVVIDETGNIGIIPLDESIKRGIVKSGSGRIALLKIDAEGAEWPGLRGAKMLEYVDRIVGEWHPPGTGDDVQSMLSAAGFFVETVPTEDGRGLFFARRQ